jgi:tetratricopeptide (TPR) repeat protein
MGQSAIHIDSSAKSQQQEPIYKPLMAFGISATTPPIIDPQTTMQRADEINTIQRMLNENRTSVVTLIGAPGIGKSTLAALLFQRLLLSKQHGMTDPTHLVWLTVNSYTTLPDLIKAILQGIDAPEPGLFQLKPDQQVSTLLRALRRPQENAFVVLDQFEVLLRPEVSLGVAGRGALPALLNMLQTDLGASKVLLTNYDAFHNNQQSNDSRIRPYLITRISLPEGIALLQQRRVQGSPEQLSLAWQRCTGNVFSLVLLSTLIHFSKTPLQKFLDSPEYKIVWSGDVTTNLLTGIYHHFTPLQHVILQILSLFTTPAPIEGLLTTVTNTTIATSKKNIHVRTNLERELLTLAQAGLIQRIHDTHGNPCYAIHSLIKSYVLEHLLDDEGVTLTQTLDQTQGKIPAVNAKTPPPKTALQQLLAMGHLQVANYYRDAIQEYCPPREQRTGPLDVEPVIGAIRQLCLGQGWQQACNLLFSEGLHEHLISWGTWNTLLGLFIAMLPPSGTLERKDEGLVMNHVGMLYGRIGEYQQSKNYFEQALAVQRQIGDKQGEAMTLTNQGEILRLRGEYEQAHRNFERAMALEQEPDDNLRCVILHNIGLLAQYDNNYSEAIRCYTDSYRLATIIGKQEYIGIILANLGMTLYQNREYHAGMALLLTALQIQEESADPRASLLERFMVALEQKMGNESYIQFCQEAAKQQADVLARFTNLAYPSLNP